LQKTWLLTQLQWKCSKRRFDGSKAEEYGSHDKTFQIAAEGIVRVVDARTVLMEQDVETNDILECVKQKMRQFKTG
jgi:monomeric isocitrate dehydrogenase